MAKNCILIEEEDPGLLGEYVFSVQEFVNALVGNGVLGMSVAVIGHSLGGYAAPAVSCAVPRFAGVVVINAPFRTLTEVAKEQVVDRMWPHYGLSDVLRYATRWHDAEPAKFMRTNQLPLLYMTCGRDRFLSPVESALWQELAHDCPAPSAVLRVSDADHHCLSEQADAMPGLNTSVASSVAKWICQVIRS